MPDQGGALAAALAKAQAEFPAIPRDKTVTVQTKTGGSYSFAYAPLDTVLGAVRGPLSKNGLALVQLLDGGDLATLLLHDSGERLEGRTALPPMQDIQSYGSAITYLRRYAIQALLGLAAEEDDDGNRADGNTAAPRQRAKPPSGVQAPADPMPDLPTDGEEREELLGTLTKAGTVKVGTAEQYKLEAHQTPDGYAFGFRLEVDNDRAIPQVLVEGQLAADVLDACNGTVAALAGKWAKVRGRLYEVKKPGRSGYYRLRVSEIETRDWSLPAPQPEAPSAPMFDEQTEKDLDALVPSR